MRITAQRPGPGRMLSRRTLLASAATALTACGSSVPAPPGTPSPAVTPSPSASPSARPTPVLPTEAEVIARHQGAVPTEWGTAVTGVVSALPDGATGTALTFDACGGPGGSGYDAALIDLLREHGVPATLFLNARWIDANPEVFARLAADPLFEIGNHGTLHRPLSVTGRSAYGIAGTRDLSEAYQEVAGNAAKLTGLLGRPPRFFRSGTAHYDEIATQVVADLGQRVAGFSVNADAGATYTAAQVSRELAAAPPGAIVIGHFNHPGSGTAPGLAAALPPLLAAGRRFLRLSEALP
ncbi:polysaccharide deacetylase [Kitasatospora sp. MMS16-BH015]|uniref:polysaccharide deacetylase family protein n=1 Tax=Kitasatospora sp. MMS16-BH015 TaxID=2018025 RepID=UPI000CA1FBC2|nr:polysaccharide deacetylase family protein [Kitasatospora sp. MMS16-BH015]AUG75462.1 polysaccharide deacetylase [Kitasatospora sp. MMS16-BH015]